MDGMDLEDVLVLAEKMAAAAVREGGKNPFDADGKCLLPTEPLDADMQRFDECVAAIPGLCADDIATLRREFCNAYAEDMALAIEDAASLVTDVEKLAKTECARGRP
jgi:hypothetical protein